MGPVVGGCGWAVGLGKDEVVVLVGNSYAFDVAVDASDVTWEKSFAKPLEVKT